MVIDFYWARTPEITYRSTDTIRYGEITVSGGFDAPPVLRITAEDIEGLILQEDGSKMHVDLSDQMCEAFGRLFIEQPERLLFKVTVDEATVWGWHLLALSPWVPRTAHIRSLYGCAVDPPELVMYSGSATIGDVPLSVAVEEAWRRPGE